MAAPPQGRPGRTLGILGILIAALAVWTFLPGQIHTPKLGLDLRGGTQVILTPKLTSGTGEITQEELDQSVAIIRQRVDGLGVAESEVTTQGSGSGASIVVSIPGQTSTEVISSLGTTAKLNFRPVYTYASGVPTPAISPTPTLAPTPKASTKAATPKASASSAGKGSERQLPTAASPTPTPTPTSSASNPASASLPPFYATSNTAALQAQFAALNCAAKDSLSGGKADIPTEWMVTCNQTGTAKYLLEPAAVLGTDLTAASAQAPQGGVGGWSVNLTLNGAGADAFLKVTTKLSQSSPPQNQFAIVLDGLVVSAPSVANPIPGNSAQITGNFTQADAKSLANVLKYGALPIDLTASSIQQIGPQLGQDQLNAGLLAGALGLILVMIYLLMYYRALGLVAVASLLVAAAITYGLFVVLGRQLGLALSLAGVAGAIVAIGITADSFVVYFERIRDEIREGKSLRTAVDTGWVRARRTILAADFVSFLAASLLYFLSVGSVRGFAFTLGLTTIVDVLVAFAFTRPILQLLSRNDWFTSGHSFTGLDPRRLGITDHPSTIRTPERTKSAVGANQKES